jgi:four helix bundle protein
MKIERFEDIEAWQEARKLVKFVYKIVNKNSDFKKDIRLVNQIQAAAVSSMSNIAEGFSRRSNKEFIQYLYISKSSAAEVQSDLYVALDQTYITQEDFDKVYEQAEIVSKKDSGFIKYLDSQLKAHKQIKQPNKPN